MKTIAVYVHNELADWETSYVLPLLRRANFIIETVSESVNPIKTMGGLNVIPDKLIEHIKWDNVALLVLPGGDSWIDPSLNQPISSVLAKVRSAGIPVAAICGATLSLARTGILNDVHHTSNSLSFLKDRVPSYSGESLYIDSLATTDRNIITASGVGAVEFAYEIIKLLNIFDEQKAKKWLKHYKGTGLT